jgi:glycosyltransferase involved in cell wall biosynthesis
MKRVVLISASAKPGGAERGFATLARLLPAHGWEPIPVLLEDGPLRDWLEPPVTVLDAGRTRNLLRTGATIRELARIMRRNDAAAVVSNLSKTHVYGGAAAALAHVPAIWWQRDLARGSAVERVAARVPAAVVVCNSEASAAAQRRLTPGREVVAVYPGASVAEARGALGSGRAIREQLGWDDAFVVGIVGRLQPWKGQRAFLEAAALIAAQRPDARFAIVGGAILGWEGDYPDELRRLAAGLGIADRVHFAGHQDDVFPWYDALDVVVHASTAEPFGRVVAEAMALGKPLVAATTGGALEIVENERSGLVVEPGDAKAIAAAVLRIGSDPELASRLALGAVTRSQRFTPERAAAEFAAVLDGVARAPVTSRPRRVAGLSLGRRRS